MTLLLAGQGPRKAVTPAQAAVIRGPETAVSPGDLANAASLLGDLGAAVLATAVTESGRRMDIGTVALATKVNEGWLERRQLSGLKVVVMDVRFRSTVVCRQGAT